MYRILFCIQFFSIFFALPLSSATMHVLVAGDKQGTIKESVKKDIKNMRTATRIISHQLDIKRNFNAIKIKKLSSKTILNWIAKAPVRKNDVFMFYFSGHGSRSKFSSKWPLICFSKKKQLLDLQVVIKAIKKKKPRLSVILCDACNKGSNGAKFLVYHPYDTIDIKQAEIDGLHRLFMKKRGSIVMCAAKPNSGAWGGMNGGRMTRGFLLQLVEETKRLYPSWKHLSSGVKKITAPRQNPLIQIKVS